METWLSVHTDIVTPSIPDHVYESYYDTRYGISDDEIQDFQNSFCYGRWSNGSARVFADIPLIMDKLRKASGTLRGGA